MADSETFSWLHLTDFHFGLQGQKFLWPSLRKPFLDDLEKLRGLCGPWNAVFFTGDLVQSGQSTEFTQMEKEVLEEIWTKLRSLDSGNAVLLPVPGNHDLLRPRPNCDDPALDALLDPDNFSKIAKGFWHGQSGAYRKPVKDAFANYETWFENAPWIPKNLHRGKLPGDFSTTLVTGSKRIGVIGLNTTFLQLQGGEYKQKLQWDASQISEVCPEGVDHWQEKHDMSILLTHQGPEWLTPEARKHGEAEITPAGRFVIHLFGHEHDTSISSIVRGGGDLATRLCQSRSAFGMEKYGEPPQKSRRHGYIAGQITFSDEHSAIRLWPRNATDIPDGWRFIPDHHAGRLNFDEGTTQEIIQKPKKSHRTEATSSPLPVSTPIISLASPPTPEQKALKLKSLRSRPCALERQHQYVRRSKSKEFITCLKSDRHAWLIADWQMGKEGFLAEAIEKIGGYEALSQVYRIDCGSSATVTEIFDSAAIHIGLSFVEFADAVKEQENVFLILEDIATGIVRSRNLCQELIEKIKPILEFSPKLRIILVARQPPVAEDYFRIIHLTPFEITETRAYIKYHPKSRPEFLEGDALEKIQSYTGGIPSPIDRFLQRGQYLNLQQIIGEGEDGEQAMLTSEPIPQSLRQAISELSESEDEISQNSFRLLKVLTVLKDGETFPSIRRLYPRTPFKQTTIDLLTSHFLLENQEIPQTAIELSSRMQRMSTGNMGVQRLLKIPRNVRDYVSTLIDDEEKNSILNSALETFFGEKWAEGRITLRPSIYNVYQRSSISGPGNEIVVIRYLLDRAITVGRKERITKCSNLAKGFCEELLDHNRYREMEAAGEVIIDLLEGTRHDELWVEIAFKLAKAYRMTGQREKSITLCEACLLKGDKFLIKSFRASIHLNMSMAYQALDDNERAIAHANEVIALEHKNSSEAIQANSIIVEITQTGAARRDALHYLYKEAIRNEHEVAANNIALELAKCDSGSQSLRWIDGVIRSSKNPYNKARGIIDKATILKRMGKLSQLSAEEEDMLCSAYAYSYTQRMSPLVDECHTVLWGVFNMRNLLAPLFRLFRYTSFFWRLRGKSNKDKRLIGELAGRKEALTASDIAVIPFEIQYFEMRYQAIELEELD